MPHTAESAWRECLAIIRNHIAPQGFATWFTKLEPVVLEEESGNIKLIIRVPAPFHYEYLEGQYSGLIRSALTQVLGEQSLLYYEVVVTQSTEQDQQSYHVQASTKTSINPKPKVTNTNDSKKKSPLIESYTFDKFIVGDCNNLAYSASQAIADCPGGTAYNPFLIYGGVGLGKTHLMQAIGNHVRDYHPEKKVLYVSSERFTTDFVKAIQEKQISKFSSAYRKIDLLIIDDVQFFGGKEKTQEEFFCIFNDLQQNGNQIVLSADRPPKEISGIEERLLSRFCWGLQADLQPPDLETRTAILLRKSEEFGLNLPSPVVDYIAHNITKNVRELEGALVRLLAQATYTQQDINEELVRIALKDFVQRPHATLSIDRVQKLVCEFFGIDQHRLHEKTKKREIVQVRQLAMYLCRELDYTHKAIGLQFGGRDHSTVVHAIKSVNNLIETDANYQNRVEEIRRKVHLSSD
ncbi:MAG: chromosomal replication initiator protein DnaA [Bacteroidetes bacterium]|nr:chromosomal replication initiator protein DnaA [Bacteroidota bacterium]MCY4234453.1 chromosomal replication initiator protein DnaA [Bacteroidota bacterium]